MAKLTARGRREWVRARIVRETPHGVSESVKAYMSDGTVLIKSKFTGSIWSAWKVCGKFDVVKPIPELRRELEALGWQILEPMFVGWGGR